MPSDTLYIRLSQPLQARLAEFLEQQHPEYPTQTSAGAALVRLGLDHAALQQRLAEEMATVNHLRYEQMRVREFAQGVRGLLALTLKRPEVGQAELHTLLHQLGALRAMIGEPMAAADDVGI